METIVRNPEKVGLFGLQVHPKLVHRSGLTASFLALYHGLAVEFKAKTGFGCRV